MSDGDKPTASFFGGFALTPQAHAVVKAGQREMVAAFRELVKKHGHQKTSLAAAVVNAEQIYNSMVQNKVPPHIIHAFKESSQHMLTEWGALAKVPQSELGPIVEGFRQHLGILDADLTQALNKGDGNATEPLS